MNTIMRTIGGALGAQLTASVVASAVVAGSAFPSESGFTAAFFLAAGGTLVALVCALCIPGRERLLAEAAQAEGGGASGPAERPTPVMADRA